MCSGAALCPGVRVALHTGWALHILLLPTQSPAADEGPGVMCLGGMWGVGPCPRAPSPACAGFGGVGSPLSSRDLSCSPTSLSSPFF